MSYGANLVEAYNQMGVQVGRIQRRKHRGYARVAHEIRIGHQLGMAKALKRTIPPTVMAIADELID